MSRWTRIGATSVVLTLLLCTACSRGPERPNVIVIMVDTLRADSLGAYGFEGDVSPNIDALASQSVRFDRCIAQSPWTSPSVASFLTSLHPHSHCVYADGDFCLEESREGDWGVLSDEARTLPEVFREAGYQTAGFIGNYLVKAKFGYYQGFETFVEPEGTERHIEEDALLIRSARDWLAGRERDRPFFLYLHFMDVHAPYRIAPHDVQALQRSPSLGPDRILTDEEIADRPGHLGARISWNLPHMSRNLRNWRLAYAAGVRGFDRSLGGFLEQLRQSGLLDESIVVLTSDHGEEFLEHGAWEHGRTYYNEGLHVPLLVRLPGTRNAGRTVERTVSLIDVMPTLIGLAGIEPQGLTLQGADLGTLLRGRPDATEEWAYSTGAQVEPRVVAMQNSRYKLIAHPDRPHAELYDLVADPGERHDLGIERQDLARQLRELLERHLQYLAEFGSLGAVGTRLSDEDVERLRSLGYVR